MGHIVRSRPLPNEIVRTSLPTLVILFAENMAAAKFRLRCTDYNGCEGHLMGIVPLFFYLNYFIWELKTSTRREVSFLLKSNVKFFDLIP